MMRENIWLICTAINLVIGLLHVVPLFFGAPAYRYLGANEWWALKAETGSIIPAFATASVAIVFFMFAAFSLAGAKKLSLPLTWYVLIAISIIYILRGAFVLAIPFITFEISFLFKVLSFIILAIGLLHAVGVYMIFIENG